MEVRRNEQRVVVEHLLEVRDEPLAVDGVAMEPAADEVVHAAERHRVERLLDQLVLATPEKKLERRRGREFRRAAEPAPHRVELRAQSAHCGAEEPRRQRVGGRPRLRAAPELLRQRSRLRADLRSPVAPCLRDRVQHLAEARQAVPRLGREVRPAEERLAFGREEDGHRPAAAAGEPDDGVHVNSVDVRTLLAVDLDRDEVLVHQRRGRLVLERLVLHHMAPVTGGVSDREEDRFVLVARAGERLLAPRVPIHRIVGVLEEIGAGLAREAVHAHTLPRERASKRDTFTRARVNPYGP